MTWTGSENQRHEQGTFDPVAVRKRMDECLAEYKRLRKQLKDFQKNGTYGQYLKSEHWLSLREKHCGPGAVCCGCGFNEMLQLHHIHYRPFGERTGDLIVLCRTCHHRLHEYLASRFPQFTLAQQVKRTPTVFNNIFGKPWADGHEVKLDGRRVGLSLAQKKGRKKARKTIKERNRRQAMYQHQHGIAHTESSGLRASSQPLNGK